MWTVWGMCMLETSSNDLIKLLGVEYDMAKLGPVFDVLLVV